MQGRRNRPLLQLKRHIVSCKGVWKKRFVDYRISWNAADYYGQPRTLRKKNSWKFRDYKES